jgi:hypothetical protein
LSPSSPPEAVLREAATRFGLDGETLGRLHDAEVEGVGAHFEKLCRVLDRAIEVVDRWPAGAGGEGEGEGGEARGVARGETGT